MRESPNPSLLAEYFPTSSSSLQQHTHLRVLWLPLSVCFLWSGETLSSSTTATPSAAQSPASKDGSFHTLNRSSGGGANAGGVFLNSSIGRSSFSDRHAETFVGADDSVSGYEVALRRSLIFHTPIAATQLNWDAFSPAVYKAITALGRTANAPVTLPFFITSDLSTSHWENMDGHRATVAVIVVVSAAVFSVSVEHAVNVVQTIFSAQFKDKVCRCILVDPPPSLAAKLANSSIFTCVSERVPVTETADRILLDIAQAVLNAQSAAVVQPIHADKADNTLVRTPVDKPNTFASRSGTMILTSRFKKKSADILLQCGAIPSAVAAYGETQFGSNVDCLWCSAVVESIAAARYQYLRMTLLRYRETMDATVVQLQSDDPAWGPALTKSVEELGIVISSYGDSLKQTIASLKGTSVPHSMHARLCREVDDTVSAQVNLLKGLLARVRGCLEAKTWDFPSDSQSYRLGSDVRRCVENVLRLAYLEIDVYLRESLRQLGKAAPSGGMWPSSTPLLGGASIGGGSSGSPPNPTLTMLRKRELETRFKRLELLAAREARQPFLEEMSLLRSSFPGGYGAEWTERSLMFFAYLCMMNGAERRARALLVEMASVSTRLQRVENGADMLLRVCALAGVGLPLVGLRSGLPADTVGASAAGAFTAAPCRSSDTDDEDGSAGLIRAPVTARNMDVLCLLSRTPTGWDTVGSGSGGGAAAGTASNDNNNNGSSTEGSLAAAPFNMFSAVEEQAPDRGVARLNQSTGNAALLNVALLLQLLELFVRIGSPTSTAALRCQLATLLLFKFPHLLDKATQRTLKSVTEDASSLLEPQMLATIVPSPFFLAWEALPLPPHLAPKTVPVGGALFTFIDTQRLKLTILCLNGRVLGSRTVWTVGDVASVLVTLYNPFEEPLVFGALALRCRTCVSKSPSNITSSKNRTKVPASAGQVLAPTPPHDTAVSDPICYVLSHVEVSPLSKRKVILQVQPTQEGTLVIDGVSLRLSERRSSQPIVGQLPAPMHIPVLQRLPQVSCTLNTSELEIFGSQRIDFTVRVVNCGRVPISCISLTAHGEQCQLEGCEGCKERRNDTDTTVTLNKRALDAASRVPLQPGDVVMIPGVLEAPPTIAKFGAHYVLFRTDLSLPHPEPEKPPNVPGAVPIYAVIPRRVTETRLRLFHSPGLLVTSVALTKDRRAVEVRVANRSRLYSMELQLSSLAFAELPDAFIVAGAEYVVPPIKLTRVPRSKEKKESLRFSVPWVVRELRHCAGTLDLDLSLIGSEEVSAEPLDECLVTLDVEVPQMSLHSSSHSRNTSSSVRSLSEAGGNTAGGVEQSKGDLSMFGTAPPLTYRWTIGGDSFNGGEATVVLVSQPNAMSLGANGEAAAAASTTAATSTLHSPATMNGSPNRRGKAAAVTALSDTAADTPSSTSAFQWRRSESVDAVVQPSRLGQTMQRAKSMAPTTASHGSAAHPNSGAMATPPSPAAATPPAPSTKVDIVIPAITAVSLRLCVAAPRWRRAIPLHVRVSIDSHFDVAVLSGAVEAEEMVGDEGRAVYARTFELFAFKTGKHLLHVTITDNARREWTNTVQLIVEHSRAP